ncbi:MAG TPA: Wzz/FepE/Etk N-terminal domain-containing protein [Caulobacteraceae bacterium]
MTSQHASALSGWASRPRYASSDLPTLLWRERHLMTAVFLGVFILGAAFAVTLQRTYPAHASVLVGQGQAYVYEPRGGEAVPQSSQVLSETEILGSDGLKEQVVVQLIQRFGWAELDPEHPQDYDGVSEAKRQALRSRAVLGIRRSLKVESGTGTPVIRLTYADTDKDRAALVLNTLLEQYLLYRRTVLVDPVGAAFEDQRRSFQDRLNQADIAYQSFLTSNNIGDFDSEKTSLSQLQAQIQQQQSATETQLKARIGRLAGLEVALGQLQAAVSSGRAQGQGASRVGADPVFQTLQTETLQLGADVNALRQSLANLNQQAEQLTQRRLRLAGLEPQFQSLSRDRDVLRSNVRDFAVKEQQTQAASAIAANTNDNIRVIERATPAAEGKSLRMPVLALSLIFGAVSALCAGLLRMFLRPGLPTRASAARTLDLPVLGSAPVKAA